MDNQEITCLVLLDLSATFNTVDHSILLNHMENHFGIRGTALCWIELYLINLTQRVVIGNMNTTCSKSESMSLKFGVPQGSVLGPILFSLYIWPLGQIYAKHILYYPYADNQQIYLSFKPGPTGMQSPQDDCILFIEQCIEEIRNWMTINMFKLNDDKIEFIIFRTHQQLKKMDRITTGIGNKNIIPIEHVRNLGFFMDKVLKNTIHINKLSSSLWFQLKNIQNIRGKLDFQAAKTVVQALILSRLNYCNSLLVGKWDCHLSHLQHSQNMACRVVCNLRKYDHVTASVKTLHWLKVRKHISYKIASLVHQCKMGSTSQYVVDLLPTATHNHCLRSSNHW